MALVTPPSWLQNGIYPAESDRLTQQALYNTTGIIGANSLAVTQNSPVGMSVRVASGWAAIIGTTQANMGAYVAYNNATEVLTITAANPTNPRIDRVVATVRDAYYSGSNNDVIFQVIAGTPAASPSAPATPANSISLATIAVAAGATQIVTANITDTRVSTTSNLTMGKILQVIESTTTTSVSGSTFGTLFDTGLSATITPISTSSKILAIASLAGVRIQPSAAASSVQSVLVRNSTAISGSLYGLSNFTSLAQLGQFIPLLKLDSPNTTSATTYKVQIAPSGATGTTVSAQFLNETSSLVLMEVAA